jgi:hypothetical protein
MRLRFLLLILLSLSCLGMGKKKPEFNIRFYTQTAQADTDSFSVPVTLLNGKKVYIDQIASVSERDIVAVYPFPVADGSGGCALKLDDHGTMSLDSLSVAKKGTILIGTINGRQVADIMIDQRVTDGIVTIPSGLTTEEMKQILHKYPILGGKKADKKKKKDVYSIGL